MKNQYFGDVRDLFKYDLILAIMRGLSTLQGFTFIPMLTEDSKTSKGRKEGNKRDFDKAERDSRPGSQNEELMNFLKGYKEKEGDKKDFTKIGDYFNSEGIEMVIHTIHSDYFTDKNRDLYFKNVPPSFLHRSLVFIDPDIGLEIKNSTEKHLLYREAKYIYESMDDDSILMIYQHFPREEHEEYLKRRSKDLKATLDNQPIYLSDNEIIFFLLPKNDEILGKLTSTINKYKLNYSAKLDTNIYNLSK
ncbi:MAG: hypothetical protein JW878_11170 [Methanomicrobia archaeon]|nr:hypothetical protein [Methanomicrobia archaeon]